MIKEFIERIGQVIRKMLGREKIKDAIGVEVAVSDKMANGIDLWAKMYKNEPPWQEMTSLTKSIRQLSAISVNTQNMPVLRAG